MNPCENLVSYFSENRPSSCEQRGYTVSEKRAFVKGFNVQVETVEIKALHMDPANVRTHPERSIEAVKASLARFGQQRPILVDSNGIVRAGNATLQAAIALGWEKIDCTRSKLGAAELTAYAIADNRTAEHAEWDYEALASQLKGLLEEGIDLEALGWSAAELRPLLAAEWSPADIEDGPDEIDERVTLKFNENEAAVLNAVAKKIDTDDLVEAVMHACRKFLK